MAETPEPAKLPRWGDVSGVNTEPPDAKKDIGWVAEYPPFEFMNWLQNGAYNWFLWLRNFVRLFPGARANSVLTITSNNVTPTQGNHTFDDDGTVKNIIYTNLDDGRLLLLKGVAGKSVVLEDGAHGAGQMLLAGGTDVTLTDSLDYIVLQRCGTDWVEVSRSSSLTSSGNAKAWGHYFVADGHNLTFGSTIARIGVGLFQVTFNTAMPDIDYSVTCNSSRGPNSSTIFAATYDSRTVNGFVINTEDTSATDIDPTDVDYQVFR